MVGIHPASSAGLRVAIPLRLVHGSAGLEQVAAELDAWLERCDAYDADPTKWLADRRPEAEAARSPAKAGAALERRPVIGRTARNEADLPASLVVEDEASSLGTLNRSAHSFGAG
jgi:anti-sigma factor RsiW